MNREKDPEILVKENTVTHDGVDNSSNAASIIEVQSDNCDAEATKYCKINDEARLKEASLIERTKQGDQQAFAELVELHQDHVYNLAYRILQNAEEADDATQEIFVKVWQAISSFRGDSKFTTWLYRIVHNHCLNRLRSTKNAPKTISTETNLEEGDDSEHDLLANLPGDKADEPSVQFEAHERRQTIWQEVENLPAKYRSIIAMYYMQELSYEEIASILEMPVGTVKTHLYRAKALLKARLGELKTMGVLEII